MVTVSAVVVPQLCDADNFRLTDASAKPMPPPILAPIEAPSDHDELEALVTLYSSGSSEPPAGALFCSAVPPGAAIQPVLLNVGSVVGVKDLLVASSNRAMAVRAPPGSWTELI